MAADKQETEYIIVTDRDSKVIKACPNYKEANSFAAMLRSAGAEITIFKALQGRKKKNG